LQVEIHKRFVNKASDWTIRKREALNKSNCSDYLIGFLYSYNPIRDFVYKSFVNFQLGICSRRLQFAPSNLPIKIAILWDNIAMLRAREHPV
jgi:hypothetical protein